MAERDRKNGKKGGRPVIPVDWDEMEKLCSLHCTKVEIAWFFRIDEDTLAKRIKEKYNMTFSEYFKMASSEGRISLRRKQYQLAVDGHPAMLIWMGKQYLDQKEPSTLILPPGNVVVSLAYDPTKRLMNDNAAAATNESTGKEVASDSVEGESDF